MNPKEYTSLVLQALGQHNLRFGSQVIDLNVPPDYSFKYHRWLHPAQGDWELTEVFTAPYLHNLNKIIKPGTNAIDIGAHTGNMSVAYSLFADNVFSFEPNPATFEILAQNSKLHPNIKALHYACSSKEEVLTFHYSDPALCNGGFASSLGRGIGATGHVVPLTVFGVHAGEFLEEEFPEEINKISFIKIDAEGHDKEIIKTLAKIIAFIKEVSTTEIYTDLSAREITQLIEVIHSLDYKIYSEKINNLDLENKGPEITSFKDLQDLQSGENLVCVPDDS